LLAVACLGEAVALHALSRPQAGDLNISYITDAFGVSFINANPD
jgi:hypothetical protein